MADTTNAHELLVTTFATTNELAKLLIDKGLITQEGLMAKSLRNVPPIKNFSILQRK